MAAVCHQQRWCLGTQLWMFYQNQLSQMEFFFQYTIGVTPYLWYFWDGEIALLFVGIDHEKMAFCELDENTSCNQPLFSQFLGCTPCSNLHHFPDENGHFWGILDILHVWTKPYSEQRAAVCTNCNWKIRSRFPPWVAHKDFLIFWWVLRLRIEAVMQKRRQKPRKMLVTVYYNGCIYMYMVFFLMGIVKILGGDLSKWIIRYYKSICKWINPWGYNPLIKPYLSHL